MICLLDGWRVGERAKGVTFKLKLEEFDHHQNDFCIERAVLSTTKMTSVYRELFCHHQNGLCINRAVLSPPR